MGNKRCPAEIVVCCPLQIPYTGMLQSQPFLQPLTSQKWLHKSTLFLQYLKGTNANCNVCPPQMGNLACAS